MSGDLREIMLNDALPEQPSLDVERLARAEHNRRMNVAAECHHGRAGNDCDIVARANAREYARLGEQARAALGDSA